MTSRKRQKASQRISLDSIESPAPTPTRVIGEIVTRPLSCPIHSVKSLLESSYLFIHKHDLNQIRESQTFKHVPPCTSTHYDWSRCHCDRILPRTRFFPVLDYVQSAQHLKSSPDDILDEIANLLDNKIPVGADGDMIVEIAVAFAYIIRSNPEKDSTLLQKHNSKVVNHILNMVVHDCGKAAFHDRDVLETLIFEFSRVERLPPTLHTHYSLAFILDQYLPDSTYLQYINASVLRYYNYVTPVDSFHRHNFSSVKIIASRGNGYISSHNTEYIPALYTSHGVFLRRARRPLRGVRYDLSPGDSIQFYASYSGSETECVCTTCALRTTDVANGPLLLKRYEQVFMRCPLDHAVGSPVYFDREGQAKVEMMECAMTQDSQRVLLGVNKLKANLFDLVKVFRLHPASTAVSGVWPVMIGESGITVHGTDRGIRAGVTLDRASRVRLGSKGFITSAVICGEERFANGEKKMWTNERQKEPWNSEKWIRGAVFHEVLK